MGSNLRLSCVHKNDDLHINLMKDLDGSSACELVDAIHRGYHGDGKVFINIQKKCRILPFGMETFSCRLNKKIVTRENIIFLGEANIVNDLEMGSEVGSKDKDSCHCDEKCTVCDCKLKKQVFI